MNIRRILALELEDDDQEAGGISHTGMTLGELLEECGVMLNEEQVWKL